MDHPLLATLELIVSACTIFLLIHIYTRGKHVLAFSALTGFLYNLFSLSFFYGFLPGSWTSSIALQYVTITVFIIVGSAVASASFLALPYTVTFFTKKLQKDYLAPLVYLVSFALIDMLRSLLLSLLFLGKESSFGLRLFLGSLGEPFAVTPFVSFAYFGGVYMLTGVLAFLVYLIYVSLFHTASLRLVVTYLAIFVVSFTLLTIRPADPLPPFSIAALPTSFHSLDANNLQNNTKERVSFITEKLEVAKKPYDIILLPENSFYLSSAGFTEKEISKKHHYILDSEQTRIQKQKATISLLYDTKEDTRGVRVKDELMLFSESTSYFMDTFLPFIAGEKSYEVYKESVTEKRGGSYSSFSFQNNKGETVRMLPLLCSEATSFMTAIHVRKENPDILVLQSNLEIMRENALPISHYYMYTRILAASTGKPLVAISNDAPLLVIDEKGHKLVSESTLELREIFFTKKK